MKISGLLRFLCWSLLVGGALLCMLLSSMFLYLNPQVPDVDSFRQVTLKAPLRIYSADGKLIQEFGERLTPLAYWQIPEDFKRALLDTEDKRFWEHAGIDIVSLVNASWQLVRNRGAITSGASTITMQLVKNVSGDTERRFLRKFKEMLLALKVEEALTKEEILTLYLNIIPFGKHAFGIQAAANTYYGKDIDQLNLAQKAMLAGIPQAPEAGNPINGPRRALARRNLVLERMLEQGSITQEQYQEAAAAPITAGLHARNTELPAPYIAEMVRQDIHRRYGPEAYNQGMEVLTTIDSRLQALANDAMRRRLLQYSRRHGYLGPEARDLPGAAQYIPAHRAPCGLAAGSAADGWDPSDWDWEEEEEEARPAPAVDCAAFQQEDRFPEAWKQALAAATVQGGLHPGVVAQVYGQSVKVVTKDLEEIELPWKGLSWAKPYINVNTVGAAPSRAGDLLRTGDLIRYEILGHNSYRLGQLPRIQGAFVAMDPQSGALLALVGGFDFGANQYNHAVQARRQPGSVFKPFFYAGALENGLTAASVFNDAPLVLPGGQTEEAYRPTNANDQFKGDLRVREAFYRSVNMVSLRVLLDFGMENSIEYMSRFGFATENFPVDVQLAFGGGALGMSPLDVTTGYAAFANGGFKVSPYFIARVDASNSEVRFQAEPVSVCHRSCDPQRTHAARIMEPRVAYIMNSMLGDVLKRGTGEKAWHTLQRSDLHGKTGTTNDADIWFSGYAPGLVATVWAGFGNNAPVGRHEWGATVPLDAWLDFMRAALPSEQETAARRPPRPSGLASVKIDPATGLRTDPTDPDGIFEIFREEKVPAGKALAAQETQAPEPVQEIF